MTPDELSSEAWNQRYLDGKTGWDRRGSSPSLDYFLRQTNLKTGHVLVPGCGNGHEVVALAKKGFTVTAIDFASTPLDRLQQRLQAEQLQADLRQGDVLTVELEFQVDAIYEQTCLCALHPTLWNSYEEKLFHWLKQGGQLWAAFMQSQQSLKPPYHCDMEQMKTLFADARWIWPEQEHQISHPSGMFEWACLLQRRS